MKLFVLQQSEAEIAATGEHRAAVGQVAERGGRGAVDLHRMDMLLHQQRRAELGMAPRRS